MRVPALCFVAAGLLLGAAGLLDPSGAAQGAEGLLAAAAYGVAVAGPGFVALIARRPLAVVAAGMGGIGVAMVASFGVTLPLAIPAVLLVALALPMVRRATVPDLVRSPLICAALPLAIVVLLVHEDPRRWSGGSTNDVTVWWESLVSLLLVAVAMTLARTTPARRLQRARVASGL